MYNTTGCETGLTTGFDNGFDNRLYRVYKYLPSCQTRVDNRFDSRLYRVNGALGLWLVLGLGLGLVSLVPIYILLPRRLNFTRSLKAIQKLSIEILVTRSDMQILQA